MRDPEPDEPTDIRAGVYRHYKGHLYLVMGYSHNASDENKPQVLYIGLELDRAQSGPRFATRDIAEFNDLVCSMHEGMEWHSEEHAEVTVAERKAGMLDDNLHQDASCVRRFAYLGPVYYAGMERG